MIEIQEKLNIALNHHQSGNITEAEMLYNQVLEHDPNNINANYLLGVMAYQNHELDKAVHYLNKAISVSPSDYLYKYLAEIYLDKNDYNNTINCYAKAIELNDRDVDTFYNMGVIFHKNNEENKAVEYYLKAIELDQNYKKAYFNLGQIIEKQDVDEAISCFQKVIELNPEDSEGYFSLAQAYRIKNDLNKAFLYYQEVINLDPSCVNAYFFIGYILEQNNKPDQALYYYQKVIELNPDHSDAYYNIGNIFSNTCGRVRIAHQLENGSILAAEYFEKALNLDPDNLLKQYTLGCMYLLSGNFEMGWELFESRIQLFKHHNLKIPPSVKPKWNGFFTGAHCAPYESGNGPAESGGASCEADIASRDRCMIGKTIYLYAVAGFGDSLFFLRYIPLLRSMGAKVLLKARSGLETLLRQSNLGVKILDEDYPDNLVECDYQLPLMSLPYVFKTNLDNIPPIEGLLNVDKEKFKLYKEKYFNNDCFKVGIFWCTHTSSKRSVNLKHFYALTKIPGVKVYSLQKEDGIEQLNNLADGVEIVNIGETFDNFTDTAAAIENLDLIISIDSSVTHISAILNKPTWLLLPCVSDWRWLLAREDSPWYKSVRIFRQADCEAARLDNEGLKGRLLTGAQCAPYYETHSPTVTPFNVGDQDESENWDEVIANVIAGIKEEIKR